MVHGLVMDRPDAPTPVTMAPTPVTMAPTTTSTTAEVHLRTATERVRARVLWPAPIRSGPPRPLVVLFADTSALPDGPGVRPEPVARAREICVALGVVVVVVAVAVDAVALGLMVIGWAADHAAGLAADPTRLVVVGAGAGAAVAALVAARAGADGWPPIERLVVIDATAPSADVVRVLQRCFDHPAPDPAGAPAASPSPRTTR
jgi:hypothetical protein